MAEIKVESSSSSNSNGGTGSDIYTETIDYIRQIEKEIVFTLDDSHLELDDCITSKDINAYCDILLSKISNELYITSNYEKDALLHSDLYLNKTAPSSNGTLANNAREQNSPTTFTDANSNQKRVLLPNYEKDSTTNIDKVNNYRYSFYDNSNTISIFVASSSMIDRMLEDSSSYNNVIIAESNLNSTSIFGCHPCSIQRNFHGFILPRFIESALIYLSKFGQTSVGIFRKSGVKSRINALKKQIEDNEKIEFDSLCVYDVADLVKTWLRDLQPHLLSKELVDSFANSKESFSLWHLPDSYRYLVLVILQFLSNVSAHSKHNQMTAHNLAICFTPSLCECETEHHILNAQKCLEYCIENVESLFYITTKASITKILPVLNRHTATAIINASPQDILNRLLYERNTIDPLISDWFIREQSKNRDVFEVTLQFSSFLPNKTFVFKREWTNMRNTTILEESAEAFNSTWHLQINGQGQTQVIHELELDLRGFSRRWYETTYAVLHDNQLKQLTSSFDINSTHDSNVKLLVSEV